MLETARKLRVQYPGAIYHVMSRGNRRERIVVDDQDRRKFLQTLSEVCQKTGWQVHAYCLMNNHFHAVVETPEPNLVDGMNGFWGPTRLGSTGGIGWWGTCLADGIKHCRSMGAATAT